MFFIFLILLYLQKSLESTSGRPAADVLRSVHSMGPYKTHISNIPGGNEAEKVRWMDTNPSLNHHGTLSIPQNGAPELDNPVLGTSTENPRYSESIEANGSLKVFTGMQTGVDSAGVSQLSTPSSTPLSPTRYLQILYQIIIVLIHSLSWIQFICFHLVLDVLV